MAEDWQVGDLALCVVGGDWFCIDDKPVDPEQPRSGGVYSVIGLESFDDWPEALFIELSEFAGRLYGAQYFRRIPPLTGDERRQAIEDMRSPSVDVRRPVPVSEGLHAYLDRPRDLARAGHALSLPSANGACVSLQPLAQFEGAEAEVGSDCGELVSGHRCPSCLGHLARSPEPCGESESNRNDLIGGQAEQQGDRHREQQGRHIGNKGEHDRPERDEDEADDGHGLGRLLRGSERPIDPRLLALVGAAAGDADRRAGDGVENLDRLLGGAVAVVGADGDDLVVHFHSPVVRWAVPDGLYVGPLALLVKRENAGPADYFRVREAHL